VTDDPSSSLLEPGPGAKQPFGDIAARALSKLTSEILVFLLAYTALVFGLALAAPNMVSGLGSLIHLVPLLGVVGYAMFRQKEVAKDAAQHGINIATGITLGGSTVRTEVGSGSGEQSSSRVRTFLTAGKSRVDTRINPPARDTTVGFLVETFEKLAPKQQQEVILFALERQKASPSGA